MLYETVISSQDFQLAKSRDLIALSCQVCGKHFTRPKNQVQAAFALGKTHVTCSTQCSVPKLFNNVTVACGCCGKLVTKQLAVLRKSKTGQLFCSQSCSAKFSNANKTTGTRRSKLECWLETELTQLYPDLVIQYNTKSAVKSELDIYIADLSLAFELNGIFHYQPIYGNTKLTATQQNDANKYKACLDSGIDLCIIDVSGQKSFTIKSSKKYLDIITSVINERRNISIGT